MRRMCCLQIVNCASALPVCVVLSCILTTNKVAVTKWAEPEVTNMAVIIIIESGNISVSRK